MKSLRLLPAVIILIALLSACASVGRIEGGPRDEEPPVYVRSNPADGALHVKSSTFTLTFNENVQLEDAFNKVVVSPAQLEAPSITANGRRVTVHLRDSLKPNTTYTIDFGDAIKDLNEGNVLDGFAIDFSTGDSIDSLRISGIVLNAADLEPAQGIIVAAYDNLADSAIRTLPPARIARTNQLGHFTIRNLRGIPYRVYALNDVSRDWHWDRSEDVAFMDTTVVPYVVDIDVTDTLYNREGGDSLVMRRGLQYLPNDLLLTVFNENYRAQYLKNYSRPDRRHAVVVLGAEPDSMPEIRIVDGPADKSMAGLSYEHWAVPEWSEARDSVSLWIADTTVLHTDSLRLSVRYRRPDSLDRLEWVTDTLRFFYRDPKRSKKEIAADTLPPRYDVLAIGFGKSSTQDVDKPLPITFSQPLRSLDTAAVLFEIKVDTLWMPRKFTLVPDTANPVLGSMLIHKWEPGEHYRVRIDSAAVVGIYDEHNGPVNHEFNVHQLEDYSNLVMRISGADSTAIVQLLDASDKPVKTVPLVGGKATFSYMEPGTYYARLIFDTDRNGEWTTGRLDSIQPEEVAYYPKKIDLKRNWDIEQDWDIYELPIDVQKPYAILKNKPKLKRGEKAPTDGDEDEEMDEFMGSGNYNYGNNRNNRDLNNRNNGNRTPNRPNMGGLGGFQQVDPNRRR